jgi:hypothetical protein
MDRWSRPTLKATENCVRITDCKAAVKSRATLMETEVKFDKINVWSPYLISKSTSNRN